MTNNTFENASKLFFVDLGNSMQKIAAFLKVLLLVTLLNVSIVTIPNNRTAQLQAHSHRDCLTWPWGF